MALLHTVDRSSVILPTLAYPERFEAHEASAVVSEVRCLFLRIRDGTAELFPGPCESVADYILRICGGDARIVVHAGAPHRG